MSFQKIVRSAQAVAVPGCIVEAVDTYKYVKTGVVAPGKEVHVGKFVVFDTTLKGYRDVTVGDTESSIAGICVFDRYASGDKMEAVYTEGQQVTILENGVVAVTVLEDGNDTDTITLNLDTLDIFAGTYTATVTHALALTKYKCVQHTSLSTETPGVVFIKA